MGDMKSRFSVFWPAAVRQGLLFGLLMGVFRYVESHSIRQALLQGVFCAVLFGVAMGALALRDRRRMPAALQQVFARRSPAEIRVGIRRPDQADPALKEDLRTLLRHRLAAWDRQTGWSFAILGVFLLVTVVLAFTQSAWWWLAVAVWVWGIHRGTREGSRLRRKLALLGDTGVELPG